METLNYPNKKTLDLSLWLDDYDDIYSDFDSRNYLKRRVSSDFMNELRLSMKYKTEKVDDLILVLPELRRNKEKENQIKKNLENYISRQLTKYSDAYNRDLKKGLILFGIAIILMVINAVISFKLDNNLLASIIRIALEPSGWFLVWIAFDILYYDLQRIMKEKEFFKELSLMKIYFESEDIYNSD